MGTTSMSDLPHDLVGTNILTRIPLTSLRAVRSTCKSWDALCKDWIIGKAKARQQFLGFMMMDLKVCSVRFDVRNKDIDVSVKPVNLLEQVKIVKVFHCDGLLLCVTKDLLSRLIVWNPYLGQTRSILPRTSFHRLDKYALGYDINRNHKILRLMSHRAHDSPHMFESEIYDFRSGSWRVLEPTLKCNIEFHQSGVSLKGVSYFYSKLIVYGSSIRVRDGSLIRPITKFKDFLRSFDFTTEKFGPRMRLPFESTCGDTVTLSCVRQKQLAILHYLARSPNTLEFWVTTEIKPNSSSWSKFLSVDTTPLKLTRFNLCMRNGGSFFIDEEEKVAVVFGTNTDQLRTICYNTVFVLGEDGFSKYTPLGERGRFIAIPLFCSSAYTPSLVQVIQQEPAQRKRKDRDDDDSFAGPSQKFCRPCSK